MSPNIPANVFLRFFMVSSPSGKSVDLPKVGAPTPIGGGRAPGGPLKKVSLQRIN